MLLCLSLFSLSLSLSPTSTRPACRSLDVTANDPGDGDWATPRAVPALHFYRSTSTRADPKEALDDDDAPVRRAADFVAFPGVPPEGGGGGYAAAARQAVEAFVEAHAAFPPPWLGSAEAAAFVATKRPAAAAGADEL